MESTINDRISQLIAKLDLSQNAFAKALGTSSSRISNITTGRNKPDAEILESIARVFTNVSTTWLLTGKGTVWKEKDRGNLKGNAKGNPILESQPVSYTNNVTPLVIDTTGIKLVPIVDIKAAAGTGYINQESLDAEDVIHMPAHLLKSGYHLCIRVKGPSMAPTFQDGGHLIIRLLDKSEWSDALNERCYVVVDTEGMNYIKRIKNRFRGNNEGFLVCTSDNPDKQSHPNFNLRPDEIAFLWYVEWYFTAKMPNIHDQYYSRVSNLEDKVDLIAEELAGIKKQLK